MKHEYKVEGMTCGSCVNTIRTTIESVPGIKDVQVSLKEGSATIEMDKHVDIHTLKHALKDHPKFTIEEKLHSDDMHNSAVEDTDTRSFFDTYKPIFLVFAYILGVTVMAEMRDGTFSVMNWMRYFMAGFFLVFSFFKMIDLPSFAASYSTYDIVAKKWLTWGYIYPFAELTLGLLFLMNFAPVATNLATFMIMGISSIGVIQSLRAKRKFQCACLGAVFNLPMSTITLIEDLLMVAMSAFMVIYHF